jgi:hypothetical protein
MKFAALRVVGQWKIGIFWSFLVDQGMKTGNKLKGTQVYLMGNSKSDTT